MGFEAVCCHELDGGCNTDPEIVPDAVCEPEHDGSCTTNPAFELVVV